jgi:hypothetical protein
VRWPSASLVSWGTRRTAAHVLAEARAAVESEADPTGDDVRAAEALGMIHLLTAQLAGRSGHPGDAETHLAEICRVSAAEPQPETQHRKPTDAVRYHVIFSAVP